MCQYSSVDGRPTDWHLVHLGALARGGAGLVVTEATAVTPEGRISPQDAGIWTDEQARDYARIVAFIQGQGAAAGIQLGHAGRKASTLRPWDGTGSVALDAGGWVTVAPSAVAYDGFASPRELSATQIATIVEAFVAAARRADDAGFDVVEIHAAHGYLLHQFLSPLSNLRTDDYGGSLQGRSRALLEVADGVRAVWPEDKPLFVRMSGTDWVDGGWAIGETVQLAKELRERGVDLIDVSSGGLDPRQMIPVGPGYQVHLARAVREGADIAVTTVGLITEPQQAEAIVAGGDADAVMLARAVLRDPSWPQRAAYELGDATVWPAQYDRARWR